MKITRRSPFSGKTNTMDIDFTLSQYRKWKHGAMIQKVMPHLSADEREFLMTGITSEDWAETFKEQG